MMREQMGKVESIYKQVGRNIRKARNAAGLTQEQLGEKVGLSRTSINNIEKARQKLLVHTLFDIAETCKIAPEDLLAKEGGHAYVPADLEDWVKRLESSAADEPDTAAGDPNPP